MAKKDRIVGAIVALLGILFVVLTIVMIPNKAKRADPGPRLFPMIGAIGMIVFGIGMFIDAGKKENEGKEAQPFLDKAGWIRIGQISALFVAYTLALKYIGYLISTPVFVFLLVKLFLYDKKLNIVVHVLFSLVSTGIIWFIFMRLLLVLLPSGMIFG